ncbi:MAG: cupin domain-containing protein [Xanthobacteraceae bacterium]
MRKFYPLVRGSTHKAFLKALLAGGCFAASTSAFAGECPADKVKADVRQPVSHAAKGVTDTVLAAIDLAKEPAKLAARKLRVRKLVIEPAGIVPWHSHGDRPAIIYIAEGEIIEYASTCAVPILHKAGDVARETSATSHWWQNNSSKTVVLFSSDLQHDEHDKNM